MLLNISRVITADNIRDILLFESDFKFENKLHFGSRFMKRAESLGVLPQEQHGGRTGHTPIEVSSVRISLFDYVRQTRINAALIS